MAKPMRAIIFAEIELLQDIRIPHNNHQDLQNQEMIPESFSRRSIIYHYCTTFEPPTVEVRQPPLYCNGRCFELARIISRQEQIIIAFRHEQLTMVGGCAH